MTIHVYIQAIDEVDCCIIKGRCTGERAERILMEEAYTADHSILEAKYQLNGEKKIILENVLRMPMFHNLYYM